LLYLAIRPLPADLQTANVGGDLPGRGGSGDDPGGRIAVGEMAESRGMRRQVL